MFLFDCGRGRDANIGGPNIEADILFDSIVVFRLSFVSLKESVNRSLRAAYLSADGFLRE